jgi:hypothetical protein
MSEFLSNLTKGSFWLGVVLVGLLINLASTWLQSAFGKVSLRYMERQRAKTDKENRRYARMLRLATESDRYFNLVIYQGDNHRAAADRWILLATLLSAVFIGFLFVLKEVRASGAFSEPVLQWGQASLCAVQTVVFVTCLMQSVRQLTKAARCADVVHQAARQMGASQAEQ